MTCTRRRLLAFVLAGNLSLAGCTGGGDGGQSPTQSPTRSPTGTPARTPTRSPTRSPTQTPLAGLARQVREAGYYAVNVAGTRTDKPAEHLYRSKRPLQMNTDAGGEVTARPVDEGIRLGLNLAADDEFAGPSVYFGRWDLQAVSEIAFEKKGVDTRILLQFDLDNDGDFMSWDETEGDEERWAGFDGDDRVISAYQSEGTVSTDDQMFFKPPGPLTLEKNRELSIATLQEELGDVSVWIGVAFDQTRIDPPGSEETVVTDFAVTTA